MKGKEERETKGKKSSNRPTTMPAPFTVIPAQAGIHVTTYRTDSGASWNDKDGTK